MPIVKGRSVSVKTPVGELRAEAFDSDDYPGLTIYWNDRQIAVVEQSTGSPHMRVLVWDSDNQDPSTVVPVFPGYGE